MHEARLVGRCVQKVRSRVASLDIVSGDVRERERERRYRAKIVRRQQFRHPKKRFFCFIFGSVSRGRPTLCL